jgi:hypothetical protein
MTLQCKSNKWLNGALKGDQNKKTDFYEKKMCACLLNAARHCAHILSQQQIRHLFDST